MTRPFGSSNGGGGLSGGGMMRTIHRSLRSGVGGATAKEPFSNSAAAAPNSPTKKSYRTAAHSVLSLSSSFTQPPAPALATWHSFESDWEYIDDVAETGVRVYDDDVFGSAPSVDEVHHAVSAIHQVVDSASFSQNIKDRFGYTSDKDSGDEITSPTLITSPIRRLNGRELDWFEPSLQLCDSRAFSLYGPDKVFDAFHLLQTEPSVQRMVVSLSTDKAVWDAVLNNEVVRELRETLSEAGDTVSENLNGSATEAAINILSWIFDNTKAKILDIIKKLTELVNELFPKEENTTKAATGGEDSGLFEDKLRTSFMLSIIVLLIVVVSRAHVA